MQEALIDTTTGEGSSKQLQQLLAWSDEELLEPTRVALKRLQMHKSVLTN